MFLVIITIDMAFAKLRFFSKRIFSSNASLFFLAQTAGYRLLKFLSLLKTTEFLHFLVKLELCDAIELYIAELHGKALLWTLVVSSSG